MLLSLSCLLVLATTAWASPLLIDLDSRASNEALPYSLSKRAASASYRTPTLETSLENVYKAQNEGGYYYVTVEIGTPSQPVKLILDTGSSDFLVYSESFCKKHKGPFSCFNQTLSSTAKNATNLPKLFNKYGGGGGTDSSLNGTFITDTVSIGGTSLKDVTLAVIDAGTTLDGAGILGVSYDFTEDSTAGPGVKYPSVLDVLYNRGYIHSHTYSLYLDDIEASSGSILFGGYDTAKFTGPLVPLPILNVVNSLPTLSVELAAVSITNASGSTTKPIEVLLPVTLDSGTPETVGLPNKTYTSIVNHVRSIGYNLTDINAFEPTVDCALREAMGSIDLTFANPTQGLVDPASNVTIAVPLSELVLDQLANNDSVLDTCLFAINNKTTGGILFGDPFLRSMYIVYDLDNNIIALAQSNFNSAKSKVIPIGKPPKAGGELWYLLSSQ